MPNRAWPGARNATERRLRALGPAERQLERGFGLVVRGGKRRAFVEHHLDVGAEQALHLEWPAPG